MKRYLLFAAFFCFLLIALAFRGCSAPAREIYRIARDPTWYPLNLRGKEKNLLAFSDDVIFSIADRQGFNIRLVSVGPESIVSGLSRGEYDAIVSSTMPTAVSLEKMVYSDPYFFTGPVLVVSEASTATSLSDLKNERVGVQTGSTVLFHAEAYPAIVMQPYNTTIQAMEALLRGEVDALIMDLIPAYTFTQGLYRGSLKVVGRPLTGEGLRLVARRGSEGAEMIREFNDGLEELRDQSAYAGFLQKWGLVNYIDVNGERGVQGAGS